MEKCGSEFTEGNRNSEFRRGGLEFLLSVGMLF